MSSIIMFVGMGILIVGIEAYCLIEFISAISLPDTIRWGVWFLVGFIGLVCVERWAWMQIGRPRYQKRDKAAENQHKAAHRGRIGTIKLKGYIVLPGKGVRLIL